MYSTVSRINLVKRINPSVFSDGLISSISRRKFVRGFGNVSGLKKTEANELQELSDNSLYFTKFLESKQEEASKSMVVKLYAKNDWQKFYSFCRSYGKIVKMYHYVVNENNFVLVEMNQKEELLGIISDSTKNQIFSQSPNPCHSEFGYFNRNLVSDESKADCENISFHVPVKAKNCKLILNSLEKGLSISELISEMHQQMKLNDLGLRLRFLTCKQMQTIISGILPEAIVFPFGSSVTGLGNNGCDLDLVVLQRLIDKPVCVQHNRNMDRPLMQAQLEIISDVIKFFMLGCSKVQYIRHARVPIVKYKHFFSALDCDLSLYCESGVKMSQILFILLAIDERIKPLIFIIKFWARRMELTLDQPGPTITNFSLTMLVIFFLQQSAVGHNAILPHLDIFLCEKHYIFDEKSTELSFYDFKSKAKLNDKSSENLLLLFFKFYSSFDFKEYGCCLKTGKIIKKIDDSPLYIKNPLQSDLNISRNVSLFELKKFQQYAACAADILEHKLFPGSLDNTTLLTKFLTNNIYFKHSNALKTHSQSSSYIDVTKIFCENSKTEVRIGDVWKNISQPKKPQYTPHKYLSMGQLSQTTLRHLRWMLQKDILKQDIFLIGRPGPTRRHLAMIFLEMAGREVEYVSLSRDTTEADLKQRREISSGTAKYFDQNAVRAAVEGRVLILEGIEKAERNVLPVLNNLLENREMHLEDGRFLIPASRYDKLLKEHSKEELDKWKLVRVSDDFRVIALGLPVPKYYGNPLDPPLRSRFQARSVSCDSFQEQLATLKEIAPNGDPEKISQLLSCGYALLSEESESLGLPDFPVDNLPKIGHILQKFPESDTFELLTSLYPYNCFMLKEGKEAVQHILKAFQVREPSVSSNKLMEVKCSSADNMATCVVSDNSVNVHAKVPCGLLPSSDLNEKYVPTTFQENLIVQLLKSHSTSDFCLIGPKGCGKSMTVLRLANLLNYEVESVVLYQDITSRDLIQQRNTLPNGDTIWNNSPLIQAALEGKLAILDGIDRVHPSILSVIHSLVHDRDIQLYDGKRLVRHDRYDEIKKRNNLTDEDMISSQIYKIHPSFRIVALAESSKKGVTTPKWLSPEMLSLFLFHEMRPLSSKEESHIIKSLHGSINEKVKKVINFSVTMRASENPTLVSLSSAFSTRQLLRMSKRLTSYPLDSIYETIQKACLGRFLPPITKEAFDNALQKEGIEPESQVKDEKITCQVNDRTIKIGNTEVNRYETNSKSKVPDILFYDIPQHLALLEWLIQDFALGEHLLLVGNQGVGKNKIADRLLQLLNRPREYIQLHRDTTVQTLTLQPTMKDGIVSYEDSPLVQAVKSGHVLVVDEADKAPTHVTCVLKTLVERSEMTLSDGRKIVPRGDNRSGKPNIIEVHPDFRMIVLANRPGFPFLGNDFFGALGDLFSCHAVDNPSTESEIALLKQYGPDVAENVILKLVRAFGELREMADKGLVQYPYSTREVVNVVKHLQNFPDEGLTDAVSNVFDFDKYSSNALETVTPVLQKHGIPVNVSKKNVSLAREYLLPKITSYGMWDISKINSNDGTSVAVSNIKISRKRTLTPLKTEVDITEARGSLFSELQSYATLPLPTGNVALALAVSKDEDSLLDQIHVFTINPFRLYITTLESPEVKIIPLDSVLPRSNHGIKSKFSLIPLTGNLSDNLLLHEENLNYFFLINTFDNSVRQLDLTSASDKILKAFGRNFVGRWKLNSQLIEENILILHSLRNGVIQVLDLNKMNCYSMEFPLQIKSLQTVSENKWLIQNNDNKKYLLTKRSSEDPIPSILQKINETVKSDLEMGTIIGCADFDLDDEVLSNILGHKISSPNRLLLTDKCYASVVVGFPELECSSNDVHCWPRQNNIEGWSGSQSSSVFLKDTLQVVTPVSKLLVPKEAQELSTTSLGFLEVLDLRRKGLQYIPVPQGSESWYVDNTSLGIFLSKTSDDKLITVDFKGNVRLWETGFLQLQRSLDDWQKMIGKDLDNVQLTIKRDSGKDVSKPKHGKVDPNNKPHVGGNTWAGGTGGRDTAGLGGKGGPYRLDAGHNVHQISDAEKESVPEEVKRAAREMGQKAFKKRLKEIKMSDYDHELYQSYSLPVADQVKMLKVVIDSVQAKSKEREWTRHQTSGDLDDLKLIEGLTGEKTIYRRRMKKEPDPGAPQVKPKRLKLVTDVSGSMYRFNSYDGRLNRMMEASVLVMEAFENQESKFKYDITGHSGDGYNINFVEAGLPPKNNKERLEVIKTMHAHSQFCMSGDHTLPATMHAIESIAQEDSDEAIVIVLSDANLERYGIRPSSFGRVLTSNPEVNAYAILIGSLGDQAARLASTLPAGRGFVCMDLRNIPQIMRQIFTTSMLSSS